MLRTGVDLGGTKIEAVVLDDTGSVRARERRPSPGSSADPASGDTLARLYGRTLDAIADVVAAVEATAGRAAWVGVGHPGSLDQARCLRNSNSVALNGQTLGADLTDRLDRPVKLANDADCLALSEATDGAGATDRIVFAAIVGTGVGGGITVERVLVTGPSGTGGEWGHNPLPWRRADDSDVPCYCGKTSCVETYVSGTGFRADHLRATGDLLDGETIVERAEAGDMECGATLDRYCDRLARSLATVINVVDPDVIVLGGGMSKVTAIYPRVAELWSPYVFGSVGRPRLVPALHGDASGVRGAALLD